MTIPPIIVLGIGNILWADEGFGVRAVETLHQQYLFPPEVEIVDGGTQGLFLLQYVQAAQKLLIFDAVDYGLVPGTLKVIYNEEVPNFMGAKKISLHQSGFQEVLAAARMTNRYPQEMVLIGVQPQSLEDYGGSLTPIVREQLTPAIQIALEQLAKWEIFPKIRTQPLNSQERLQPACLEMQPVIEPRST